MLVCNLQRKEVKSKTLIYALSGVSALWITMNVTQMQFPGTNMSGFFFFFFLEMYVDIQNTY